MKILSLKEAAHIKKCAEKTIRGAIARRSLTPEYKNELRQGYMRRVIYILDDEKFQSYNPKTHKRKKSKYIKIKKNDAWVYRNDAMGKECANYYCKE